MRGEKTMYKKCDTGIMNMKGGKKGNGKIDRIER